MADDSRWRRSLARELTRCAALRPDEAIDADIGFGGTARRIGITGPPGAGKSSLIATLASHWIRNGDKVGVLAIDPTSPLSGGSLLGDRIRMEEVAENPNLYIRSMASSWSADGLCPNISALLGTFERYDFEHIILETVGVGQVSYEAKSLVDTFVLVVTPESGDTIQAMKAGILEVADIYVINKADLPMAQKLAVELRTIARWRGQRGDWVPPIILTSVPQRLGIENISKAINNHRNARVGDARTEALVRSRMNYHIRSLLMHRLDETLSNDSNLLDLASKGGLARVLERLLPKMDRLSSAHQKRVDV